MTSEAPPFEHPYNLGELNRGGAEVSVKAGGDALARIAAWADVSALESFGAQVRLKKTSSARFSLDADLTADVVQACVVTLEPVKSRIERQVHRELHLIPHMRHKPNDVVPLSPGSGDDDVPEEIDSLEYDLAAPLLEEFVLALDPYPRAPGVEFSEPPEAQPVRENPFAVLKSLKNRL